MAGSGGDFMDEREKQEIRKAIICQVQAMKEEELKCTVLFLQELQNRKKADTEVGEGV